MNPAEVLTTIRAVLAWHEQNTGVTPVTEAAAIHLGLLADGWWAPRPGAVEPIEPDPVLLRHTLDGARRMSAPTGPQAKRIDRLEAILASLEQAAPEPNEPEPTPAMGARWVEYDEEELARRSPRARARMAGGWR